MEYNKTKRGLEKAAAILSVVAYALEIIAYISLIITSIFMINSYQMIDEIRYQRWNGSYYYYDYEPIYGYLYRTQGITYLIMGIILLTFCIIGLIMSAKLIKTPVQADGIVKKRSGLRITLLVFSLLSGNWITAGLIIAVLCLKDFKPATQQNYAQQLVVQPAMHAVNQPQIATATAPNSIDSKLAKLKEYKELGIIDDDTYKKAVAKLINDSL